MKSFYQVEYRPAGTRRSFEKTIIPATTAEEAKKAYNNPAEIGLNNEIKSVREVTKIPAGWVVTFRGANDYPTQAKAATEIDLTSSATEFFASLRGKMVTVRKNSVIGASPAKKDPVMSGGRMW